MDAKIGKFFESVGSFFSGGDTIPWCDRDIIAVTFLTCPSRNPNFNSSRTLIAVMFCYFEVFMILLNFSSLDAIRAFFSALIFGMLVMIHVYD